MSRQIQLRRGSSAEHETFTGAIGEVTVDTTSNTLRVHDGQTVGGTTLAKRSEIPDLTPYDYVIEWQMPSADNNYTWYRKYKSGWVEQGGYGNFDTKITLPLSMSDTKYTVCATAAQDIGGSGVWVSEKTQSSFRFIGQNYGSVFTPSSKSFTWIAYGFAAE